MVSFGYAALIVFFVVAVLWTSTCAIATLFDLITDRYPSFLNARFQDEEIYVPTILALAFLLTSFIVSKCFDTDAPIRFKEPPRFESVDHAHR